MERCECCGQPKLGKPAKKRGRWTFLKSLKVGESLTFDNWLEHERARDAARHYNIPYKAFKHKDGTGYSLVICN